MTKKLYQPDPEEVSKAVARSETRAENYLKDPEKSKRLLNEAIRKVIRKEKLNGPLVDLWRNLKIFLRLLRAYFSKQYTDVAWGTIVVVVGAVIYFVSPIDLMPDWIPLSGFIDDAAVLMFAIAQIKSDLDRFLLWEQEQQITVIDPDLDNIQN
jgi:uncharacterized membrane protein YkvA (DUF1232 family)